MLGDRAESRFVKVAEHLDDTTVRQIEKLDLPGVGTDADATSATIRWARSRPISWAACSSDGIGLEGLELKFEKLLAGKDGFKRTLRDFRGRPLAVAAEDYLPPQHGQHLILTIDANIQMIAEQELAARLRAIQSQARRSRS